MELVTGLRLPWALQEQSRHEAEAAARRSGQAGPAQMSGNAYDLALAMLFADRRRLKEIKSIQGKVAAKREMLPAYRPYIAGVLAANAGVQDEVLVTVLTWALDIGDLEYALALGAYAMGHGLETPDRFERDTPSLLLEQLADELLALFEANRNPADWPAETLPPSRLVDLTALALELTRASDMHDQIRAKGFRAHGYALRAAGQPAEALTALRQALDLNDKCGVKKDIERLEREVKKLTGEAASAAPAQTESNADAGGQADPPESH